MGMSGVRTDFELYLEDVFEGDKLFDSSPVHFSQMKNFMITRNKKEFLDIRFDKDLFGFNN